MTDYQAAVIAAAIITGSSGRWNYAETLRVVLEAMSAVPEPKFGAPPTPQRPRLDRD